MERVRTAADPAPVVCRAREVPSPELVVAVNRIFHDLEGGRYDERHDEIFSAEAARWSRFAAHHLAAPRPALRILDVGTGTGFVPSRLAPQLGVGDELVATDLSRAKLECCRHRVGRLAIRARCEFHAVDGVSYPFADAGFDLITANSVLHHIPDLGAFFRELDRLLRPGGWLAFGHEPNRRYHGRAVPRLHARFIAVVRRPHRVLMGFGRLLRLDRALRRWGVRDRVRRLYLGLQRNGAADRDHDQAELIAEVGRRLVDEGHVARPLTAEETVQLIDFHSPTATPRIDRRRGIDADEILRQHLPGYRVRELYSYDHLGESTEGQPLWSAYESIVARLLPRDGASLFAVLEKPRLRSGEGVR